MSDYPARADGRVTESCGNVFADLGFPPDEAEIYALRSELMNRLEQVLHRRGWSAEDTAARLAIEVSRAADLLQGKWQGFSLETLIALAARAGLEVRMQLTEAA